MNLYFFATEYIIAEVTITIGMYVLCNNFFTGICLRNKYVQLIDSLSASQTHNTLLRIKMRYYYIKTSVF